MSSANAQFYSFGNYYSYSQPSHGGQFYGAGAAYAAPQAYYRVPVIIAPTGGGFQSTGSYQPAGGFQSAAPIYGETSYGTPYSTTVRTIRIIRVKRPAPVVYQAPAPTCDCVN